MKPSVDLTTQSGQPISPLGRAARDEVIKAAGPHRAVEFHFSTNRRGKLVLDGAKIPAKNWTGKVVTA